MPVAYYYDNDITATLFISGTTNPALFGGKDLFLKGYPRNKINSAITIYTSGGYNGSDSLAAPLYMQGGYDLDQTVSLYTVGSTPTSGWLPLTITGNHYSINNNITQYISGADQISHFGPLVVSGVVGANVSQCVLYIQGPNESARGYVDLFIRSD
jgi:hypothetical protein